MAGERFLTAKETSRFLKISIPRLNRFIKQEKIYSHKVGGPRLLNKDELIEWVRSQKGVGHRN
jgi:excisionase family DNA binding protein